MDRQTADSPTTPARPCPDPQHGEPASSIGNRRSGCRTCNAFARRLERAVTAALRDNHPDTYHRFRETLADDLYAKLLRG